MKNYEKFTKRNAIRFEWYQDFVTREYDLQMDVACAFMHTEFDEVNA